MGTQQLRDKNVFPTEDVWEIILGKCYAAYKEFMDTVTSADGVNLEWRFYNDGKAWLGKVMHKKKTLFWLSIWQGFFKTSFYFTEKNREGVMELNIDTKTKQTFAETKPTGKLLALSLNIDKKRQIKEVLEIIAYKKMLK